MKMVRVTVKQKHQMNMHRLITSPFRVSSLAPSEKGTLWRAAAPVEEEAHDGLGAQA